METTLGLGGVVGETVLRHEARCRWPGCTAWFHRPGDRHKVGSAGLCPKHYRSLLRYGDPGGARPAASWNLREAALAYGLAAYTGQGTAAAAGAVVEAAWRLLQAVGRCGVRARPGDAAARAQLLREALFYANWDTAANADTGFEQQGRDLETAALVYGRSLAFFPNRFKRTP